jgi:hypothetical protein
MLGEVVQLRVDGVSTDGVKSLGDLLDGCRNRRTLFLRCERWGGG